MLHLQKEELLKQEAALAESFPEDLSGVLAKHREALALAIDRYELDPRFPYVSGPRAYQC